MARYRSPFRRGLTLVELLVVMAIIGILVGLLLPAVNSIRESGRLTQCCGNLRQLAQGCLNYANARGELPPVGAGNSANALGDPNATGLNAGSWLYAILPFVEQQPLHDLGEGLTGTALDQKIRDRVATPVSLFVCASRGSALFSPASSVVVRRASDLGNISIRPTVSARSDYAGCLMQQNFPDGAGGALGVTAGRGRLLRAIEDGLSNVFLSGERFLTPQEYRPDATTMFECNNRGWSVLFEGDVYAAGLTAGAAAPLPPLPDATTGVVSCGPDARTPGRFGSSHHGVPMVMVAGSVHVVRFDITPSVFADLFDIRDARGTADQLE